jgi:hypothetical protein
MTGGTDADPRWSFMLDGPAAWNIIDPDDDP